MKSSKNKKKTFKSKINNEYYRVIRINDSGLKHQKKNCRQIHLHDAMNAS